MGSDATSAPRRTRHRARGTPLLLLLLAAAGAALLTTACPGRSVDFDRTVTKKMTMENYFFDPDLIRVPPRTRVRLILNNPTSSEHNFSAPDLDAFKEVAPGKTATLEFVVPMSGEWDFQCTVGNHAQLGMTGVIDGTEQ